MKKVTVTIGIPAHNEQASIGSLLSALLTQKQESFVLEKVYVLCDGCSDNTADIAQGIATNDTRVCVIDDGLRKGQVGRLNEAYELNTSDVFVTFDGDVHIEDPWLIEKLIAPFHDPRVGLVGGNNLPYDGTNFIQRAIVTYELAWRAMTQRIRGGHNVHNNPGCICAVRNEVIQKEQLPIDIVANDHYLYFLAKRKGYEFRFAKEAIVHFTVPNNLTDFFHQTTRFLTSQVHVEQALPETHQDYSVPILLKLRIYVEYVLRHPVYMSAALFLQLLQRIVLPFYVHANTTIFWQRVNSSKV